MGCSSFIVTKTSLYLNLIYISVYFCDTKITEFTEVWVKRVQVGQVRLSTQFVIKTMKIQKHLKLIITKLAFFVRATLSVFAYVTWWLIEHVCE